MTHHKICDECETVAHCSNHGCIPKVPAPVQEPVAIPEYIRDAAKHLHENRFEPSFMVRAIVGWINSFPPAAQPAVQEPVFELQKTGWEIICDLDWIQTLPFGTKLYTTPPAAAVPDALNPKDENPAYAAGWNDCRAEMLKGMK